MLSAICHKEVNGVIDLPAVMSDIHNRGYGIHAVLSGLDENAYITNWKEERSRIEWMFHVDQPGTFEVKAIVACIKTSHLDMEMGDVKTSTEVKTTGGMDRFKTVTLGKVTINEAGDKAIEVSPVWGKWQEMNLKSLQLVRL